MGAGIFSGGILSFGMKILQTACHSFCEAIQHEPDTGLVFLSSYGPRLHRRAKRAGV